MSTQGKSIAAGRALDCLEQAEDADRGTAPNPDRLIAKAQVYAILAVAEILEGGDFESPVFTRD